MEWRAFLTKQASVRLVWKKTDRLPRFLFNERDGGSLGTCSLGSFAIAVIPILNFLRVGR